MADQQIEALTDLGATPATGDLLVIVDVSDTTDDAGGTTKKVSMSNALGSATLKATLTAKGMIYAASGASTPAGLAVGTNGTVLTAASGETTGLKWGTLPTKDFVFQPTAMQPLETAAPGWEVVDFGTVLATVASFDDTTIEYLLFKLWAPAELNTGGTVYVDIAESPKTGAASKNTGWLFESRPVADGEAIDGAYGSFNFSGAVTATTGYLTIQTGSETVTNLGWVANDVVLCRLSRKVDVANDLTGDLYKLLVRIRIPVVI